MAAPTHPFRRVAILTHYFEPLQSIQVNRLEAFCRFFRAQGLEVLVLTRYWDGNETSGTEVFASHNIPPTATTRPDGVQVVRYPTNLHNPTRRRPGGWRLWGSGVGYWLQTLAGRLEHTHDFTYGNEPDLLQRLRAFAPDFLLTSLPMHYLGPATAALAQQLGVPFWVDIRDLHNNELAKPGYRAPGRRRWMDGLMQRRLRWVCSRATLVTTISQPFEGLTRQLYGARQTATLTNGYEEALFAELRTRPVDQSCFRISYTGSLYPQQLHPAWLQGFAQFLSEVPGGNARVDFIGSQVLPQVAAAIEEVLPAGTYAITPRQPRAQVVEAAAASAVLFYAGWPGYKGIYSGKIFEYLGLHRPILLAPGDSDVLDALLAETQAGTVCNTAEAVHQWLSDAYAAFQAGAEVPYAGKPAAIARYSREAQLAAAWQVWQQAARR